MTSKEFTYEQMEILKKNPYTLNVTSTRIMFSIIVDNFKNTL